MASETPCQTDGAVYGIGITDGTIMCHVELPFPLRLTATEEVLLRTNLHNAIELVLARYWVENDPAAGCQCTGSHLQVVGEVAP